MSQGRYTQSGGLEGHKRWQQDSAPIKYSKDRTRDNSNNGLNSTRGTNLEAHRFNGWTARGHQPSRSDPINESWHALGADACRCTDCDQMGL